MGSSNMITQSKWREIMTEFDKTKGTGSIENSIGLHKDDIPELINVLEENYNRTCQECDGDTEEESDRIEKSNNDIFGIGKPRMKYPKPQPKKQTGKNQYEIWGNVINTNIKFNCIIEAESRKQALWEADENIFQLVNDNPQGKTVAVDFGARLHIPESN